MKGKIIAAVAAAVCIVPIAYTLTTGHKNVPELMPDRALLTTHVDVPDTAVVVGQSATGSSHSIATAVDHPATGSSMSLITPDSVQINAAGHTPAAITVAEQPSTAHVTDEPVTNNEAPTADQPALTQTYPRTVRSASVLSPSRRSSAPTIDSAGEDQTLPGDATPITIEVAPDALADLSEPLNQPADEPTSEYVPIVSTLSPALDHVLPTDELVDEIPAPTSVPVPGTLALLGMGLLALGASRRRSLSSR